MLVRLLACRKMPLNIQVKHGGVQKSMGRRVPWKIGVLICHPVTSRSPIFPQKEALLTPCNFATTHLTASILNCYLPDSFAAPQKCRNRLRAGVRSGNGSVRVCASPLLRSVISGIGSATKHGLEVKLNKPVSDIIVAAVPAGALWCSSASQPNVDLAQAMPSGSLSSCSNIRFDPQPQRLPIFRLILVLGARKVCTKETCFPY